MLEEAHQLRDKGIDVVLGFIETHRRARDRREVGDLEVVPRRRIDYRGVPFEEMDVDAILARKPEVAIVDELAHTNVAGSKHEKRYQDIEELLARRHQRHHRDQHPARRKPQPADEAASPASRCARRCRIRSSRAPIRSSTSTCTVEALRERLREGKIYPPAQIEQALKNFFKPSNLASLREAGAARGRARPEPPARGPRGAQREGGRRTLSIERIMVGLSSNAHDRGQLLRKACAHRGAAQRRLVRGARRDAVRVGRARSAPATSSRCSTTSTWPAISAPKPCG